MILDCGHEVNPDGITAGYGIDQAGRKHCYACCAEQDRASMTATGRAVLYLTMPPDTSNGLRHNTRRRPGLHWGVPGSKVTNWPGSLSYPASVQVSPYGHNWGLPRYDVWFTDYTGRKWHGVTIGDNTELCHCRRLRGIR